MKPLFESIEKEISKSLNTVQNLSTNGNQFEVLAQKINLFSVELERLNKTIPELSNEYNRTHSLSESDVLKLKEFIDNSMSDFLKKSGVPGVNTKFKFDTKLL